MSGVEGTARDFVSSATAPLPEDRATVVIKTQPPSRTGLEPVEVLRTVTDGQGKFKIALDPGDYIIEVTGRTASNGVDNWAGTGFTVFAGAYTDVDLLLSAGGLPGA